MLPRLDTDSFDGFNKVNDVNSQIPPESSIDEKNYMASSKSSVSGDISPIQIMESSSSGKDFKSRYDLNGDTHKTSILPTTPAVIEKMNSLYDSSELRSRHPFKSNSEQMFHLPLTNLSLLSFGNAVPPTTPIFSKSKATTLPGFEYFTATNPNPATSGFALMELNRFGEAFHSFMHRRPRGEKRPIPEEQKDEKYYERRKRNNEAAKKSRDARKIREDRIAFRAALLEQENSVLRAQNMALRDELQTMRQILNATTSHASTLS